MLGVVNKIKNMKVRTKIRLLVGLGIAVIVLFTMQIMSISEKIGTFETSILPYEDCCTIFVAKHPVTKPNLNVIKKSEKKLEGIIEPLLEAAYASDEVLHID